MKMWLKKCRILFFSGKVKYSILSNRANLSNSTVSLIIPPDFFAFIKFIPASLIVLHCESDIRGFDIGRK